jgi:hypothetical protein
LYDPSRLKIKMSIAWAGAFFASGFCCPSHGSSPRSGIRLIRQFGAGRQRSTKRFHPFLKIVPGVKMEALDDCQVAAKQDPRVDLQNCVVYFREEMTQTRWRYAKSTAWVLLPPFVMLLLGGAIGWVL